MSTQCNTNQLEFLPFKSSTSNERTRRILGRFDADKVSSDGGVALLREAEHRFRVIRKLSECFTDHRDPRYTTHCLLSIVAQRVLAICCGYEDIVDHDRFRIDPMAGMFCGTSCALAGKSTLNRMELGGSEAERYKKIVGDFGAMDTLCVELFMRFHGKAPTKIVLDIDVTDDPVHGNQEGRFYHGYYTKYCYAPSYIFCGRHLLGCRLRKANQDSAAGAVEEFERIEKKIEEYHRALEEADAADEKAGKHDVGNDEVLREKIEKLKRRQEEKREFKSCMERSGDTQVSVVDPDARLLRKPGQSVAGYNAQIAVDSKHKLVVAEHVVQNSTDHHQLAGMLTEAKERLEVKRLTPCKETIRRSGKRYVLYMSRSVECKACSMRNRCVGERAQVRII